MPSNPSSLLSASTSNLISVCLLIPMKSRKVQQHLSYVSNTSTSVLSHFKKSTCLAFLNQFQCLHLTFPPQLEKRGDIFSVSGLKKLGKGDAALMEMSDLDDEEDEMGDDIDGFAEDDETGEEEDEEMFLPLGNMRKFLENKPRGFGEGKVYDTSIEDKLLDEIEQSRRAQAANIDKLKENPVKPASVKDEKKKATELVPSGIRVRVANLPKKKNIDRDLRSAFKGVPGIVNIIPAVSGNKKTKDPICKGFAFVDFKSEEHADRFVQQFSGHNVAFGRIQKRIKCLMTYSQSSTSSDDESASSDSSSTLTIPDLEEDINASVTMDDSLSEEDTDEVITAELQDVSDSGECFSTSESVKGKTMSPKMKLTIGFFSSRKRDKNQVSKKKKASKVKEQKVPKLEIPGSAKRLKIKEKSVLVDVFTKYGSQSTLVSGEES